jgi:hypothetical protein
MEFSDSDHLFVSLEDGKIEVFHDLRAPPIRELQCPVPCLSSVSIFPGTQDVIAAGGYSLRWVIQSRPSHLLVLSHPIRSVLSLACEGSVVVTTEYGLFCRIHANLNGTQSHVSWLRNVLLDSAPTAVRKVCCAEERFIVGSFSGTVRSIIFEPCKMELLSDFVIGAKSISCHGLKYSESRVDPAFHAVVRASEFECFASHPIKYIQPRRPNPTALPTPR